MTKLKYSHSAVKDLEEIGDYITETLHSPLAALNTVGKIQDIIDKLADFPLMGALLSSIFDMETDYRFLVSGNYIIFYRVQDDIVYIDRVLYNKRDYIAVLFHDLSQADE